MRLVGHVIGAFMTSELLNKPSKNLNLIKINLIKILLINYMIIGLVTTIL